MARDTAAQAGQNSATAQVMSGTYGARAAGDYNVLTPTLNRMATAPQGFGAPALARMNTSALDSVGGAQAAAQGQTQAAAGRTNNQGAFQSAMTSGAHDATGALSDAALGVQKQNAMLQQQQQQSALGEMGQIYGQDTGASQNALGLSTNALQAQTAAQNQTMDAWLKPLSMFAQNAASAATAGA